MIDARYDDPAEADCRRQLSLGPEAALSLLIGQMIQEMVYADPHNLPKHPELEAAAIALVTTFQVS
jgi:MFS superfamily sulfate permease-like transporter